MTLWINLALTTLAMSALVALYLLLRARYWQKIRPISRYAIGVILAAGLLVLFRPALPWPLVEIPVRPTGQTAQQATQEAAMSNTPQAAPPAEQAPNALAAATNGDPLTPAPTPPAKTKLPLDAWRIFALVWVLGALVVAIQQLWRHLRFRRMVRRWHTAPTLSDLILFEEACKAQTIRKKPALLRCDFVQSPMLVGLLRPVLLLPAMSLTEDELRAVFRHELVHLRRHDLWYKAIVLAAVCLHWFNPIVRRMAKAISADCEMACDEAVLSGQGLAMRKWYGETILGIIERQKSPHVALSTYFYEGRNDMKRRFSSMLTIKPVRTGAVWIAAVLALTLCAGSVLAVDAASNISPTTGLAYAEDRGNAYRPVLVEISNSVDARPSLNLSEADVVYEYVYWGPSHTRYLALYNDVHPQTVGSSRSSRLPGQMIRTQWDCPYAYWGSQDSNMDTSVSRYIVEQDVPSNLRFDAVLSHTPTDVYSQIDTRETPHDAVFHVAQIVNAHWPKDVDSGEPYAPAAPPFAFHDATPEGPVVQNVSVSYGPDYEAGYTFDESRGLYLRAYDGAPQVDGTSGKQLAYTNLIIQSVDVSYVDNIASNPYTDLYGKGTIHAFIEGRHVQGTWAYNDTTGHINYKDASGKALTLSPGKTFIHLIPEGATVTCDGAKL